MEINSTPNSRENGTAAAHHELHAREKWRQEFERARLEISNAGHRPARESAHCESRETPAELPHSSVHEFQALHYRDIRVVRTAGPGSDQAQVVESGAINVSSLADGKEVGTKPQAGAVVSNYTEDVHRFDSHYLEPVAELPTTSAASTKWHRQNAFLELSSDGASLWIRDANLMLEADPLFGTRLARELAANGLRLSRIFVNGVVAYLDKGTNPPNEISDQANRRNNQCR